MANFELIPVNEQEEEFRRSGSPVPDPANAAPAFDLQPEQPEIAPYDWTAAGVPLPEAFKPVGDVIAAFNSGLAGVAGIPVDAVDALMRQLGSDGLLDKPGSAKEALIRQMEKVGIAGDRRREVNKFLGDMGEATAHNTITLMAMMAFAPQMIAAEGSGAIANFMRTFGKGLQAAPGTAITAEFGAAGGQAAGRNIGDQMSPEAGDIGEVVGSFLGGMGIPALSGAVGGLVGGIPGVAAGLAVPRGVRAMGTAMGRTRAMINAGRNATGTGLVTELSPEVNLIGDAIRADQMRFDGVIDSLVKRVTHGRTFIESADELQRVTRSAEKIASTKVDEYWKKVDVKQPAPKSVAALKSFREGMIGATVKEGRDEWLPHDLLTDVKGLKANSTIENLRAIRTKAMERLRSGVVPTQYGTVPVNDKLRGNLRQLVDEITAQIDNEFPNDAALKQANAMTSWYHDQFTRGPVAKFALTRAKDNVLEGMNVDTMARTAMRQPAFGPRIADLAEETEMPALRVAGENLVRGALAAEFERVGPQAAQKLFDKPATKAFLRSFPETYAQMTATMKRIEIFDTYRREVMNSTFIKSAGEMPQTAVRNALTGAKRVQNARNLMARLRKDPDAIEAAKNQTILELESMANGNPAKILDMLSHTDTRKAVQTILGDDIHRLERIASHADEFIKAASGGTERFVLGRASRVMGAWIARRVFNSGTLQAPQFGGDLMQRTVEGFLNNVEGNIFSKAVRYPAWEAVLNAKVPTTLSEMRKLRATVRNAIRVEEATERQSLVAAERLGSFFEDRDDDQ